MEERQKEQVCIERVKKFWQFVKWLGSKIWVCFGKKQIGHLLGAVALVLAFYQVPLIIDELQADNFNKMNDRYMELYKEFPKIFSSDENKDKKMKYNLARRYFNLWSDEYYLCTRGVVPKEFMNVINHGACVNLVKYPDLIEGYYYWKKLNAFGHSKELMRYIENIIDRAKIKKCSFEPVKGCSLH